MAVELAATLATGLAGVIAAFHLSVPDRSRAWAWLPAPFAVLWMSLSGWGCYADWAEQNARGWALGQSSHCFFFILFVGVPLAALLGWRLRRSSPLQPRLTAALGAVGVAGLSAFILQFFHPFDVTVLDLGAQAVLTAPLRSSGVLSALVMALAVNDEMKEGRKRVARLEKKLQAANQISEAKLILMRTRQGRRAT